MTTLSFKVNQYRNALNSLKARFMCKPFSKVIYFNPEYITRTEALQGIEYLESLPKDSNAAHRWCTINSFNWLESPSSLADICDSTCISQACVIVVKSTFNPWNL